MERQIKVPYKISGDMTKQAESEAQEIVVEVDPMIRLAVKIPNFRRLWVPG